MKPKYLFIPFILMFITASAIKYYQYNFIKPSLPQSLKTYNLFSYAIFLVFLIFFAILYLMLLAVKNHPQKYIMKRNIPAGIFALLAGISMNLYSIYEYVYNKDLTNIHLVFNCASCIVGFILMVMAISSFAKKNILKDLPLLTLAPAALFCFELGYTTFFTYPNLIEISTQSFKMLSVLSFTLFSFAYAKLLSNFQTNNTFKKAILFGLMCFSVIFVYSAPDLIFNFNGLNISEILSLSSSLFLGFFAVSIAIELMQKDKIDELHAYNEEDFSTFDPSSVEDLKNKKFKEPQDQNFSKKNTTDRPTSIYFENLIQNKSNTKSKNIVKQIESIEQELDADALVDDILNNDK